MKFFTYNNTSEQIEINEHEVLLVREFAELWKTDRNKCKEDPTGTYRLRAFRELTFLWLFFDWSSPYCDFDEQDKNIECKKDAHLTEEEYNDPTFREACRKYKALQDSSRVLKLLKSAQSTVTKLNDYFDTIDFTASDPLTHKPIYSAKDTMNDIKNLPSVIEGLKDLEEMYKKEQEAKSDVRGDATPGFADR